MLLILATGSALMLNKYMSNSTIEERQKASLKPATATSEEPLFKADEILKSVKPQLLSVGANGWAPSGIIALACTASGAKQIASMIKKSEEQSSYTVIFPGDEQEYVIDDEDLAQYKEAKHPLWRKILGCAIRKKFPKGQGVYGTEDAWQPAIQTILETLTGKKIMTTWIDEMTETALARTLQEEMRQHEPVLFSTKGVGELTDFSNIFKRSTAYPVLSFDADKNLITVPRSELLKKVQKLNGHDYGENKDLARVPLKEVCQFGRFISFPQP
jgi:hypothetical protein